MKQHIFKYYTSKFDKLLSLASNKSLSKYLFEIEQNINYETDNLFPFIDKFITEQDKENIISIIINVAFNFNGNANEKSIELFTNDTNGLDDLLIGSMLNSSSHTQGTFFIRSPFICPRAETYVFAVLRI